MSFLAELRRRNVIRMAGLYLVGAWPATQPAATLLGAHAALASRELKWRHPRQ